MIKYYIFCRNVTKNMGKTLMAAPRRNLRVAEGAFLQIPYEIARE